MAYIKKANQLKVLILEDDPNRIEFFKMKLKGHDLYFFDIADDAINAFKLMNDKPWDIVFLDHDLGGLALVPSSNPNTGYAVAKYMAENEVEAKQIIIHSMNPAGSGNMKSLLPEAVVIPFSLLRTRL